MRAKLIPQEEIITNGDAAVANMSFRETSDIIDAFMVISLDRNLATLGFSSEFRAKVAAMRELYIERMHKPACTVIPSDTLKEIFG